MPKRIQMTRNKPWRKDNPDAVIVDRRSNWGNKYIVGEKYITSKMGHALVRDNAHAVELFRTRQVHRIKEIARLRGRDLACWCPLDQPCHADVLLEVANRKLEAINIKQECPACEGVGDCWACEGQDEYCTACDGTNDCGRCEGEGYVEHAD